MKARRTRLAALFASALMLTSTFSPLVYAEDATVVVDEVVEETADEAEDVEEVAAEAVAEEAEEQVLDAEAEEVAEPEAAEVETYDADEKTGAYTVDPDSVEFLWSNDSTSEYYQSKLVKYQVSYVENGETKYDVKYATATVDTAKSTSPKCVEKNGDTYDANKDCVTGHTILTVTIDGEIYNSSATLIPSKCNQKHWTQTDIKVTKAPGHITTDGSNVGYANVWYTCSDCGMSFVYEDMKLPEQEHDFTTEVIVPVDANSNIKTVVKEICGQKMTVADLDANGDVQLVDETKDGTYYIRHYCSTKVNGSYDGYYKEMPGLTGKAEKVETKLSTKIEYAMIISQSDKIATNLVDGTKYYYSTSDGTVTHTATELAAMETEEGYKKIELSNCSVAGTYTIGYFNKEGKITSQMEVTVPAHHMEETVVEFTSKDDKAMCTVTYNKDGSYTIKNNSCYLSVTYNEVVHCTAAGCPLKDCANDTDTEISDYVATETDAYDVVDHDIRTSGKHKVPTVVKTTAKVAEPEGDHVYDTKTKATITDLVNQKGGTTYGVLWDLVDVYKDATTKDDVDVLAKIKEMVADGCSYEALQAYVKKAESGTDTNAYVDVSNDTSTCTEDGTCDVTYTCMVCKSAKKTEQVKVVKKGHLQLAPVREIVTAATCDSTGTYNAVTYCGRCKAVLKEVREQTIPAVKHTNDLSRYSNGVSVEDNDDTLNAKTVKIVWTGDMVVDVKDGSYLSKYTANQKTNTKTMVTTTAIQKNTDGTTDVIGRYIGYGIEENGELSAGYYAHGVVVTVYSYCDTCGTTCDKHPVQITLGETVTGYKYTTNSLTLEITDIQKQDSTGNNGSITLKATYTNRKGETVTDTQTFPYYTAISVYEGRQNSSSSSDSTTTNTKNGLTLDSDGIWRYYKDDTLQSSYTGLVYYQGSNFYVINGVLANTANGMTLIDSTWYYLQDGRVRSDVTDIVLYNGEWFAVRNGQLYDSISGIVEYNGGLFLFDKGWLIEDTGLHEVMGTWYLLSKGQVQEQTTGVVSYQGGLFLVVNGVYQADFNGTYSYGGVTYTVVNGQCYA